MVSTALKAASFGKATPMGVANGQPGCPLCELGRGLTAQVCLITPDLCREWVADPDDIQRRMRQGTIHMVAADITEGRWLLNGQPFIFDRSLPRRRLLDGRHRARAVILADKAVESLVVTGIDTQAFYTMDQGSTRTKDDALGCMGYEDARTLGSAAQLLHLYVHGAVLRTGAENRLSPVASIDVVQKYPALIDSLAKGRVARKVCRSSGIPVFCHYVLSQVDEEAASVFFHRLATGEELKAGDPVLALRNRLLNERFSQRDMVFLMFKVWNLSRMGKTCIRLQIKPNEPFPEPA